MTNTITASLQGLERSPHPAALLRDGPRLKNNKRFFYVFYPAHLAPIALIQNIL